MDKMKNDDVNDTPSIPFKKQKLMNDADIVENVIDQSRNVENSLPTNINEKKVTREEKNHKNDVKCVDQDETEEKTEKVSSESEDVSGMSLQSEASESDWQPATQGALDWIYSQMLENQNPREILLNLMPNVSSISNDLSNLDVWKILIRLLTEPPRRTKLPNVNTLDDVINLIKTSRKIMVLTGAGVSVSCGIPDFRSRNGVYARLAVDFPDLPNPEAMFSISYFKQDPRPFFKFAKEIYPGQFKPSLVHRFISLLEKKEKLLRNYTQNIDTLEQVAGISKVIQCHGSFATASCQVCKRQVDCEEIRDDVFNQIVPKCTQCQSDEGPGILKPDIVFFGENLPQLFHRQLTLDKDEADLLIVVGSALKVRPVALIPNSLPENIPQILINREPLNHINFDVELLGDADGVVAEICRRLGDGYEEIYRDIECLSEITELPEDQSVTSPSTSKTPDVSTSNLAPHSSSDEVKSSDEQPQLNDQVADKGSSPDVSQLQGMWKSRWKQSISKKLPNGTYYYDGKHRYVFPGAEIPPEEESDCSSDDSSDDSSSDDDDNNPVSRGVPSFLLQPDHYEHHAPAGPDNSNACAPNPDKPQPASNPSNSATSEKEFAINPEKDSSS